MENEQKPKDIKVEFSCEVKEQTPSKNKQMRNKRAL